MHRTVVSPVLAVIIFAFVPANAGAQNVGIRLLHDGDCKVTVDWPANTDISGFRLMINGQPATRVIVDTTTPFTVNLAEPLRERDNISASAACIRYDAEVNGLAPGAVPVEACGKPKAKDDER